MVEEKTDGVCSLAVHTTINIGNMEFLKIQVSYEESYTGIPGDTRKERFGALLAAAKESIAEAHPVLIDTILEKKDTGASAGSGPRIVSYDKDF